jgi:hypothetical protein
MRVYACQDTEHNVGGLWVHCNLKGRRELAQPDIGRYWTGSKSL